MKKVNVRCDATRALGEIGNKKAVDKVINMLYDEWVNVRIYAVTSLGKLNDVKAVPALIDVMKTVTKMNLLEQVQQQLLVFSAISVHCFR